MKIIRAKVAELTEDPQNARLHPKENLASIVGSLEEFGQVEPLVVQKGTRKVIGGNGRLVAMRELGWDDCDIVEVDLDDPRAKALGIALNRTGELAEWNYEQLSNLFHELDDQTDLAKIGWQPHEVAPLLLAEWQPPGADPEGEKSLTIQVKEGVHQEIVRDAIEKSKVRFKAKSSGATLSVSVLWCAVGTPA